ncbi:MAG: ATP-binding protein [Christensenellales bacterium]|jgi:anti-sigma regulatory factor (Ser/Thr protein kinase)
MSYASRFVLTSIEDIKTVANAVLNGVGRYAALSEERRYDIALVINELLANSFEHAAPSPRNPVVLAAGLCGKSLCIGIRDGGEGFEVEETLERLAQPMDEDDLYKERGRGLRLVQALCKEINFGDRGNNVEVKIEL